jgi:hypothetical protein
VGPRAVVSVCNENSSYVRYIQGCIQKFPDWPPGVRTALGAVVSLFYESV